jgi:hypothetical protein
LFRAELLASHAKGLKRRQLDGQVQGFVHGFAIDQLLQIENFMNIEILSLHVISFVTNVSDRIVPSWACISEMFHSPLPGM